eukprot:1479391-Rhodomonas_salina.1
MTKHASGRAWLSLSFSIRNAQHKSCNQVGQPLNCDAMVEPELADVVENRFRRESTAKGITWSQAQGCGG